MIKFIKYYALEIYTVISILVLVIAGIIGDLSVIQKFVLIYIFLFVWFVFMALEDSEKSTKTSGVVTEVVVEVVEAVTPESYVVNEEKVSIITRKVIGHFGYNVLMGLILMLAIYFLFRKEDFASVKKKYLINHVLIAIFGSIVIAILSEVLQLIPAGRSCEFKDMLIDFSGGIFGVIISYLILLLVINVKNNKAKEQN